MPSATADADLLAEVRGLTSEVRSPLSEFRGRNRRRLQAGLQLLLDFFLAAFEHVHGDVGFAAVLELESCVADFGDFFGWKQAHAIDECQVCHELILNRRLGLRTSDLRLQTSDFKLSDLSRARDGLWGGGRDALDFHAAPLCSYPESDV